MAEKPLTVGDLLRSFRLESGLSLRQLEEASGVDRSAISRIEHGQRRQPGATVLQRLAQGLGVDSRRLLLAAAGQEATEAAALPAIRPYLRTKYGHLSPEAQTKLAELLEDLERGQTNKQ